MSGGSASTTAKGGQQRKDQQQDKGGKSPAVRLVVQQCISARLKLPPDEKEEDQEDVTIIGRGMVVFVCFLSHASEQDAVKAAESVCAVRLCEPEADDDDDEAAAGRGGHVDRVSRVALPDLPGDVLVVPQATLGARLKGKSLQYHSNVEKTRGRELYSAFVQTLTRVFHNSPKTSERAKKVAGGVYGARQVLSMDTNGPYTHIFEF